MLPLYYTEDTVLISDDANNQVQGEHLYGIFTSPEYVTILPCTNLPIVHSNGPAGSALCVYGFGTDDTIHTVFQGMYVKEIGENQFIKENNLLPIDVSLMIVMVVV